jgi:hypothetical protein
VLNQFPCMPCVWYIPTGTSPRGTFPMGNMNMARKTARTVTRSARIQLGGHLEISISISINMFGLGRPFLVAVINQASR